MTADRIAVAVVLV